MTQNEFVEMTFVQGGLLELKEDFKVSNKDSIEKSEYLKERIVILKEQIDEIQNSLEQIDENTNDQDDERIALNQYYYQLKSEMDNIFDSFWLKIPVYSFYIATYPTTQEQWLEIMGNNPSHFKGRKNPVESIKWLDALEYCNLLSEKFGLQKVYEIVEDEITFEIIVKLINSANGYRLPNHIQWLFAAKGGRNKMEQDKLDKYEHELIPDKIGWFAESFDKDESFKAYFRKPGTKPVGKKKPNALGIYDMLGNVSEMCWDSKWTYEYAKYIEQCVEKKIKLADTNGPESSETIYALGKSWNTYFLIANYDEILRDDIQRGFVTQGTITKSTFDNDIGFRVALPYNIQ